MKSNSVKKGVLDTIRRLREESGKSLRELCGPIGMSQAFWCEVEAGKKEPSLTTLERMATALGVNVRDLLKESSVTDDSKSPKKRKAS